MAGDRNHEPGVTSQKPGNQDKELEKELSEKSSSSNSSVSLETEDEPQSRFEPIVKPPTSAAAAANPGAHNLRLSRETLRSTSLRRERSNNGYGVDELDVDAPTGEPLAEKKDSHHHRKSSVLLEKGMGAAGESSGTESDETIDPYEVRWNGGDSDPLNPRSMPLWRKWVIVGITSFGSLCV